MDIETKNASLDTLSVTIQALHVNDKQMTLAVFRQLPVCSAYLSDGTINEDLQHWGLVRYTIKDEGELWLVASDKSRLFRCNVNYDWKSVERAKNDVGRARRNLEETLRYEKELAATSYYEKLRKEADGKCPLPTCKYAEREAWLKDQIGPRPMQPSRPRWEPYRDNYTPSSEVRRWLMGEDFGLLCSMNAEVSKNKIMQLIQLFIAV